jgi:Immunity protein 21
MTDERRLQWVEASHGPLVLIPASISARAAELLSSMSEASVQVHRLAGKDVLALLDDECFPTTFLPTSDGGELIRWVFAESEAGLLRAAGAAAGSGAPEADERGPLRMHINEQLILLSPAGASGAGLNVDLPAGDYSVTVRDVRPDDETLAIVVLLSRVP